MSTRTLELETLTSGIAMLQPILTIYGFSVALPNTGSSSGGRFATVEFAHNSLVIGLIVRFAIRLGCPNYTEGHGYTAHDTLISELKTDTPQMLVPDDMLSYKAVDGGNPFAALAHDLSEIVFPSLASDPDGFSSALARSHRRSFGNLS